MTRQDVKNAIKAVIDSVPGVSSVHTFRQKSINQTDLPNVEVSLPKSSETRLTQSAPVGKKLIEFTALLQIKTIDTSNDGSEALLFDDLLDAIDDALRKNPTLGGAVLASTVEYINTTVAPPTLVDGQNVMHMAIKQFDITVQVTG